MVAALLLAAAMNFGSYWFSDRLVLSLYQAQEVHEQNSPLLYRTVRKLADKASLPMTRVYVIPSASPRSGLGRLVAGILAPVAAVIVQMAVSRSREYEADAGGAELSGKPLSLASALGKLQTLARKVPMSDAKAATAHLFIVNPLSGSMVTSLFSTHPPTEERIARLKGMAERAGR